MAEPVLALDGVANGEAGGWRRGAGVIETLPYIDTLTAEEKANVDKVIQEEMRQSAKRPSDFLSEVPPAPPSRLQGNPLLLTELQRIKEGQPMQKPDNERLSLPQPPLSRRNDVAAWRTALENAHSQLEHQYNRLLNLELLLQYGPLTWQAHLKRLEVTIKRLEEQSSATKATINVVNSERKVSQTAAQKKINELEDQWRSTLSKNAEIGAACRELEMELAGLQQQLHSRPDSGTVLMDIEAGTVHIDIEAGTDDVPAAALNGEADGPVKSSDISDSDDIRSSHIDDAG